MTDEETTVTPEESEGREDEPKIEKTDFLQLIANALKTGTISSAQAKQMRAELGVFQGDFTKKKTNIKRRKQKRKDQAKARRVTAEHGYKGQKFHHLGGTRGR